MQNVSKVEMNMDEVKQQSYENEELEEAMLIARGLKDIEEGNVVAGPEVLMNIRNKYGL